MTEPTTGNLAMTMPAVAILAGGLATRMRPLTEKIPKSLLDVAGTPFIVHQLRLLRREGIRHVVLCLGFLGEQVEALVGDGSSHGLHVEYSYDGDRLLGTGGALRNALPLLSDPFMVLYGDSYLDIEYAPVVDAFYRSGTTGLMTVYHNAGQYDSSNVVFAGGRVLEYSKRHRRAEMEFIDYGLGVLQAGVLEPFADRVDFDLAEVYENLVSRQQLAGFEVGFRFYEIGSPEGLAETCRYVAEKAMPVSSYTAHYLDEVIDVVRGIDRSEVDKMVRIIADLRRTGGRLFFVGVGGGAGHAGHAVNDFRKIAGIECYAPTDNVSELTARINDDGWNGTFAAWLKVSRLRADDVVFVFSVGGGNLAKNISANIVAALQLAKDVGAKVVGVVGRDGGFTRTVADACVVIPTVNPETVTPHTEAFQAVIWHLIVSHPDLKLNEMKWESVR
jgi:D-sedoheptulose 7-phosphate isomerase